MECIIYPYFNLPYKTNHRIFTKMDISFENVRLNGITLNDIVENIKNMDAKMDDEYSCYPKITKEKSLNLINYNKCIENILHCIARNILCNQFLYDYETAILFSFNLYDKCPYTNYSYFTIFFGPPDNFNFYKLNQNYHLIKNKICELLKKSNMNQDFSIEINEKFKIIVNS